MLGVQKYHILQNPRLKKCQVVKEPQRQNLSLPQEQTVRGHGQGYQRAGTSVETGR